MCGFDQRRRVAELELFALSKLDVDRRRGRREVECPAGMPGQPASEGKSRGTGGSRVRPPPGPMANNSPSFSGMQQSRSLQCFGDNPAASAAHFTQTFQCPRVEGERRRDDILPVDFVWQTERYRFEMELD